MTHRDELQAAQERIEKLQERVEELEGAKERGEAKGKTKGNGKGKGRSGSPALLLGGLFSGIGGVVLLIVLCMVVGGRACVACNDDVTDPALETLRKCPLAREALGDDIGWSMVGCSNYRSRTGGDPITTGCSSSSSWEVPVAGSRGRGSYRFSASQPAGKANKLNGGSTLLMRDRYISIAADGTCTAQPR